MSDPVQFGRTPFKVVQQYAAAMLPSERAIYMALANRADVNWLAWGGLDGLAFEAGVTRSAACRAMRGLCGCGFVLVAEAGGGRGRATIYRLETNCDRLATVSALQTRMKALAKRREAATSREAADRRKRRRNSDHTDTVSWRETVTGRAEKLCPGDAETVTGRAVNCVLADTPTKRNRENRAATEGGTAAGGCAGGEEERPGPDPIGDALALAGIGEPKRAELADRLRVIRDAPLRVARAAHDANDRGKGTGALIRDLEALADAERVRAAQQTTAKQPRPMPLAPRPPAAKDWQPSAIQAAADADEGRFAVVLGRVVEREFSLARQRQIQALVEQHGKIEAVKRDGVLRAAMCRALGLQAPRAEKVEVA